MFDYDDPKNEVRCLMTRLKNAIDAEHQDNMRENAELHERIAHLNGKVAELESDRVKKDERINDLTRDSDINREAVLFMIFVVSATVSWSFWQVVLN